MPARFQNWFQKWIWRGSSFDNPNSPVLASWLGTNKTSSGESVTHDAAFNFSAVWRCVSILSGVISYLPFKIYERTDKGRRQADNHPYWRVTKNPNSYTTRVVYFNRAVIHYLNWGYHIAKINYLNDGIELELIHPSRLKKIEKSTRNKLTFTITDDDGEEKKYTQSKIIYVPNIGDGLWGKGVITHAREDIGLEFAAQKYGAEWFKAGGKPQGLISTDEKLNTQQIKDAQDAFTNQKSRDGNMVLTHGFKYTSMLVPPDDSQFLGTRQFSVSTIARWYGVPPEKLAELDRATYGNLENNGLAFLADTVTPILAKIEQEYTTKLLDENKYYFEFDIDGYMRADTKTQAEVDRIYVNGGITQINEVRRKKNWNPVEYGDENYMQLNMTTLENIAKGNNVNSDDNGTMEDG